MRPTILVDAHSILAVLKFVPEKQRESLAFTRLQTSVDAWLERDTGHICVRCGFEYTKPTISAFASSIADNKSICPNCLSLELSASGHSAVVIEAESLKEMTVPIDNLRDALIQYLAEHVTDEDHDTYALVHEALCATKGNHIKDAIVQIVDQVESTLPKPHSI